jgi:CheY-like chemotaxis protein
MPVMNGVEFLHALERRRETGEVRVVLVSAYGIVDRVALGSPRIVGRLHKPVEMGELRQLLDGQLGTGFGLSSLPN